MADIPPLQPQHTEVNAPEAHQFRTSAKQAGFPAAPFAGVAGHTPPMFISGPVLPVGRFNQYAFHATELTTYSVPVATPNQKIGPSGATVL